MKVYIGGPMTGHYRYNQVAFYAAADAWNNRGHAATTPFDTNSQVWHDHYGRPFDPGTDKCDYGDPILAEMIAADVQEICDADALVVLPGWQESRGTRLEVLVALTMSKPIFDAVSFKELHVEAGVIIRRIYQKEK